MSSNPLIFLDFDGVLNSELFYRRMKSEGKQGHSNLDPEAVVLLNQIILESFGN